MVLIPVAALGLLIPMLAAASMAFSSIFVVTNSLRMRGYKVQAVAPPKSLPRQLAEMAPQLVAPAIALAILIALSTGWIKLPGMSTHSGGTTSNYRVSVMSQPEQIVPGQPAHLTFSVTDQAGRPVTAFDVAHEKLMHLIVVNRRLTFVS